MAGGMLLVADVQHVILMMMFSWGLRNLLFILYSYGIMIPADVVPAGVVPAGVAFRVFGWSVSCWPCILNVLNVCKHVQ